MSTTTQQLAPQVTVTAGALGTYTFRVDGRDVVTVSAMLSGRQWRCSPDHQHGRHGGCSWVPLGEHLDGCGWVATGSEWHVYLSRALGGGRYFGNLPEALDAARGMAEQYTRCSRPVAARLCRLVKRHDGPCVPWA